MTIKQQGGIFGRNPTFNDLDVEGSANLGSNVDINGGSVDGITLGADGQILTDGFLDLYKNGVSNTLRISSEGNSTTETNAIEFYRGASTDRVVSKIALNRISDVDTGELRFYLNDTAGTLQQNITMYDTGNVALNRGNLVMANGQGIDFSATTDGSGTSTSELLDDYEEGTFQNTIEGGTTAGTCTYVLRLGRYTKIGDQVHFGIQTVFNTHTGTGDFVVGGLPYTVSSANGGLIANVAVYGTNMTFSNQLGARLIPGTTTAKLLDFSSGSSSLTTLGIKASGGVYISGTYEI